MPLVALAASWANELAHDFEVKPKTLEGSGTSSTLYNWPGLAIVIGVQSLVDVGMVRSNVSKFLFLSLSWSCLGFSGSVPGELRFDWLG